MTPRAPVGFTTAMTRFAALLAMLAMLVQMGLCHPAKLTAPSGQVVQAIVCPLPEADPAEEGES